MLLCIEDELGVAAQRAKAKAEVESVVLNIFFIVERPLAYYKAYCVSESLK